LIRTFQGHHGPVWDAAIAPDSSALVTVSEDGTAIVWSPSADGDWVTAEEKSFAVLPKFTGHTGPIYSVAYAPDSSQVVTGGQDRQLLIWSPQDIEPFPYRMILASRAKGGRSSEAIQPTRFQLGGHTAAVRSIDFSDDGTRIVSAGNDNTVRVWNAGNGQLEKTLRGHSRSIPSCAFVRGDSRSLTVLSGSHDGDVKLWNVADYQEYRVLQTKVLAGHDDAVLSAAFDADGDRVITASRDRTARIWDVGVSMPMSPTTKVLKEGHEFLASTARFSPSGDLLVTAAMDDSTRIWDARSGAQLVRLTGTGQDSLLSLADNGRLLLTGSSQSGAKLWDTKRLVRRERIAPTVLNDQIHPQEQVTAVALSRPDGRFALTGDHLGRCILWELSPGNDGFDFEPKWNNTRHGEEIVAAEFTANAARVITASRDGSVRVWDRATGQEVESQRMIHPEGVVAMVLVPDGKRLLTSCGDSKIRVWDVRRSEVLRTFDAIAGGSETLASNVRRNMARLGIEEKELARKATLSPAALAEVLSGGFDGQDATVERLARTLRLSMEDLYNPMMNAVTVSKDGETALTTSSEEGRVWLWNVSTGQRIPERVAQRGQGPAPLPQESGMVWSAVFSPDDEHVLIVGGRRARLWSLRDGQEAMSYSPHSGVVAAGFSPDGRQVVTASRDGSAKIWDAANGQVLHKLVGGHRGPVYSAQYAPDGSRVLTASDDGTARIWDPETGLIVEDSPTFSHEAAIRAAHYMPDGRRIVTVSDDRTAVIWDVVTGERLQVLAGHDAALLCVAFSPQGRLVVTGSRDQTSRVWSAETGEELAIIVGHTDEVTSVAVSPDGNRVLTGSGDQTVKLWDAIVSVDDQHLREVLTLKGHQDAVTSVRFSPDGQSVVTASRDGTAILWEAEYIAPRLHLPADELVLDATDLAYPIAADILLSSPMAPRFEGSVLTVEINGDPAAGESLAILPSDANGLMVSQEGEVMVRGDNKVAQATGGADGEPLQVQFDDDASAVDVEAVIRSVHFLTGDLRQATIRRQFRFKFRTNADHDQVLSRSVVISSDTL